MLETCQKLRDQAGGMIYRSFPQTSAAEVLDALRQDVLQKAEHA